MTNDLDNFNQILAICLFFKSIGVNSGSGLHINIGADYLECNEKAINNLLKIWGECEELFYMIANPEGETIRANASLMVRPIKENIQNFFKKDGSVTINSDEDMEILLFRIQAQNRMYDIINGLWWRNQREFSQRDIDVLHSDEASIEEKFEIYKRYKNYLERNPKEDDSQRWTSINFNHMKWNANEPGRIEIRIFNSSLEPEIIFQDLLLVAKVFEVSLNNAKNNDYKKEEFDRLLLHDVTEETKLKNLLDLLFDTPEEKEIFRKRWESIRGLSVYEKFETGIPTYKREEKNRE